MAKLKAQQEKAEEDKKQLRLNLDDAENRVTKGEVMRRALEGDLQRMKLSLNDKETENQVRAGSIEGKGRILKTSAVHTLPRVQHRQYTPFPESNTGCLAMGSSESLFSQMSTHRMLRINLLVCVLL